MNERSNDRTIGQANDRKIERANDRTSERSNDRTIEQWNNRTTRTTAGTEEQMPNLQSLDSANYFSARTINLFFIRTHFPIGLLVLFLFVNSSRARRFPTQRFIGCLPQKKGVCKMRPVPGDSGRSSSYFRIRHS